MADQIEIDVWQGEIADLEVDAVIVPANESLFMTSALAADVKRRAGLAVEAAAVAQGPVPAGSAVVTPAGNLAASYVIHAVAVGHDLKADRERLVSAIRAALDAAEELGLRRLAMAMLGSDRGVFAPAESATLIAAELSRREGRNSSLQSIVLTVRSAADAAAVLAALRSLAETR